MIQEVYDWLESRTGSPYDFRDEISEIDLSEAFLAPTDWYNTILLTISRLEDCIEDINEHSDEIPDDLPDAGDMKRMIIWETTALLLDKVNDVKEKIGIKVTNIKDTDDLTHQASMLSQIINICKQTKIEFIIKKLTSFEELYDNYMMDTFDITPRDYSQLYSDITDIVEEYEEDDE